MSVDNATVVNLLENILFESPAIAPSQSIFWTAQSQSVPSESTVAGLAAAMAATAEIGVAEHIYELYASVLGRAPTGSEISYYTAVAEQGLAWPQTAGVAVPAPTGFISQSVWNQITDYFVASPEFSHKYLSPGPGISAIDPVAALYQNILGRTASASELTYYHGLIDQGTSMSTLVQYFIDSPEYQTYASVAAQNAVVAFGVGVASNGGTGHEGSVGGAIPPSIPITLSGLAYNTTPPTTISNGSFWIEVYDPAVLTVDSATQFSGNVTSTAGAVVALENGIQAHHVAWGVYAGNTYVVETKTGTVGPDDTTTMEIIGVHTLTGGGAAGLFHVA